MTVSKNKLLTKGGKKGAQKKVVDPFSKKIGDTSNVRNGELKTLTDSTALMTVETGSSIRLNDARNENEGIQLKRFEDHWTNETSEERKRMNHPEKESQEKIKIRLMLHSSVISAVATLKSKLVMALMTGTSKRHSSALEGEVSRTPRTAAQDSSSALKVSQTPGAARHSSDDWNCGETQFSPGG
ncbi:hypothetical protein STEG23_030630, partial [Scotinomys teguina]